VVVNLPVERDRRVIRECIALEDAGYRVTVVCPRGEPRVSRVPGTRDTSIRSFRQPWAGHGVLSFAVEFLWSFMCVAWHVGVLVTTRRVVAVQVCNPPDVFWPIALAVRAVGRKWIFDHHDLCPELYECKTPDPNKQVLRVLKFFERMSIRCASAVTTTNESYRSIAIDRGGARPEKVTVVRNGPALREIVSVSDPMPASDRPQVVYLGVMGPQDRVDIAILTAERLAELRDRNSFEFVLAGDGECMPELRKLVEDRGLGDIVTFTGWLDARQVDEVLQRATVAIQPDPPTDMAHLSTMAKTIEYLARGVPVVSADLLETRRSADDAAIYVSAATPEEFAKALDGLLSDPAQRAHMREIAIERFRTKLAWEHQAAAYTATWNSLVPVGGDVPQMPRQHRHAHADPRPSDLAFRPVAPDQLDD
jgi:glycosyltransferase involved in cell wall biosynthesis